MSWLEKLKYFIINLFGSSNYTVEPKPFSDEMRTFLSQNASLYAALDEPKKQ